MPETSSVIVQIVQFVVNLLILGAIGIWRLSQTKSEMGREFIHGLSANKDEVDRQMTELWKKQNETERWVLEQFVRREDLKAAIEQINLTLADIRQRFDTRMDRIENKIDNLTPTAKK